MALNPARRARPRRHARLASALVLVGGLAVLTHLPSLSGGFVNWDDAVFIPYRDVVEMAPAPGSVDGQGLAFYPVFRASLWLDRQLWGTNPLPCHAENLFLHVANALLVYAVIRSISTARPALIAALLFAVHPLNVEAVAWVSGRKVLLALFFSMASYLCWMKAGNRRLHRLLSTGLFALACLSNALAAALVFLLIAHDLLLRRKRPLQSVIANLDMLAIAGAAAVLRLTLVTAERDPDLTVGLVDRVLATLQGLAQGLMSLAIPKGLSNLYPLDRGWGPVPAWSSVFAVLFLGSVALAWSNRQRRPQVTFLVLWPWLALLPSAVHHLHRADRHYYLAGLGAFALAAQAVSHMKRKRLRRIGPLALLCLVALAWRQTDIWRNSRSLWSHAVRRNPDFTVAHSNLGSAFVRIGQPNAAVCHFRHALAYSPNSSKLHYNLADALWEAGRYQEARSAYGETIRLEPGFAAAYNNLGRLLSRLGEWREAESWYRKAIRLDPTLHLARFNLGVLLAQRGRYNEAESGFRRALAAAPTFAAARVELGRLLCLQGRKDEAGKEFDRARRDATDVIPVHANLAEGYAAIGRYEDAARHAGHAAGLAETQGRVDEARRLRERAAWLAKQTTSSPE